MRSKATFLVIIILVLSIFLVVYAKINFRHIEYKKFFETSMYNYIGSEDSNNWTLEISYEHDLGLEGYFIDENIKSIDDLKKYSDYILIVSNETEPFIRGNSIINDCIINKVIKGDNIFTGDHINIYDLVYSLNKLSTNYIGGNTPLKIGDRYIVFLKKTTSASINNAYVFSSVKYGRVSLNENRGILKDYEYASASLEDITNYDFVFSKKAGSEVDAYLKMVKKIRKYANSI